MKAFNVYLPTNNLRFMLIDTVYFTDDVDADYVRFSLIRHDGYSGEIYVEEVK